MAVETIDELFATLAELVRKASGVQLVIRANQGHAPPDGHYASYNPIPIRAYGQPRRERYDVPAVEPVPTFPWQDMREDLITAMELMVSINFFDAGARNAALLMQQAQYRAPVSDYCYANEIAWRYTSETRNLTGVEMASVQERYQLDLHLWVETKVSDTLLRAAGLIVQVYDENDNLLTEHEDTEAT